VTDYITINEFDNYLQGNRVRHLTVIVYRSDSGVWSERTGEILRHPEFGGTLLGTSISFRLHTDLESPRGYFTDLRFMCEYNEHISFERSEEGAKGTLHGFRRIANDEYDEPHRVDIVAHARTR
jgi:hypothetical protein